MYKNQSISRFHLLENSIKITFQIGQRMMPTFTEINKLFFKFLMNTMAPNNQSDFEKQSCSSPTSDFKTKYTALVIRLYLWHKTCFLNDCRIL